MNSADRRFIVPEIVQTSGMDCGPATLASLLNGMGIAADYGRLREACQTDVDGTSIDMMEEIAIQLGLDAEQIMIPADHLILPEADALPAIVIVRLPNGFTHFVVAWRLHGSRIVQIMDPATGRRWPTIQQFLETVYEHSFPVPASDWREWADSDDFLRPLRRRLKMLGLSDQSGKELIDTALADAGWHSLARLDATVRLTTAIIQSGGLKRGKEAAAALQAILPATEEKDAAIPDAYWSVRPLTTDDGEQQLSLRGAVIVRAKGKLPKEEESSEPLLSPELVAALNDKPPHPAHIVYDLLRKDGVYLMAALLLAAILSSIGVVVEWLLLRGLLDLGQELGLVTYRVGAITAVILFMIIILFMELNMIGNGVRLGRLLEIRLRIAFLKKIPRLHDQYFHSRPISDMAQRSHSIHRLRELPMLGLAIIVESFTLLWTTIGIIWLSPASAPLVIIAAILALGFPLMLYPLLTERDMRMRTHTGALSRFFLDGMLGLTPIRVHGAETAVRREHETLLGQWLASAFNFYRVVVGVQGGQTLLGYGMAILILFHYLQVDGTASNILLLAYWTLILPHLGEQIAIAIRQYPGLRNTAIRLLEPLGAPEDDVGTVTVNAKQQVNVSPPPQSSPKGGGSKPPLPLGDGWGEGRGSDQLQQQIVKDNSHTGTQIKMEGVGVRAAGHTILSDVNLTIHAGEHVAIIGRSGAGKSSLASLLLGWNRPAVGMIFVDKQPLNAERLAWLRQHTAWVDPAIQLWNDSFINNLYYGNNRANHQNLSHILEQADLLTVLRKLPDGLQTTLGENGGLLSGGEGQRVRLGRAMLRSDVQLVILDEAFRGLDRPQRKLLLQRARTLWSNATLLCITHDVDETETFDRVLVMDDGHIIEDDSPAILRVHPDSQYAAMLQAEQDVKTAVWGNKKWRRWKLNKGELAE